MNNMYTSLQLRGGTKEEHLTGGGVGFVGQEREVTVDTTDFTLRVHDGNTIGGHPLLKVSDNILASHILFNDGESLQTKYDKGELGGANPPITPPTNTKPNILAIDVKNKLQNGTATILYYINDKEQTEFVHKLSIDNGRIFKTIEPTGTNPYEFVVSKLSLGQNLCALKISDGELEDTKYFIVDIPLANVDTPAEITDVEVSEIKNTSFKVKYAAKDIDNDLIQRHQISLDNGYSYKDIFSTFVTDKYEANITGLLPGTTYYCRLKVLSNSIESATYGFTVNTTNVNE